MVKNVTVIGGDLTGSEAAWQLAKHGIEVDLYEMRPKKNTPAHEIANLVELVCINSMRSNQLSNVVGLLKEEMRQLDPLIVKAADETAVLAGGILAVDRDKLSPAVTKTLKDLPNVRVHEEEITKTPKGGITTIAIGPLTSDTSAEQIKEFCGTDSPHFFGAAASTVATSSVDRDIVYKKSCYDKGEVAYLNCPMTKEELYNFHKNLVSAETATLHGFEDKNVFEGCVPIEVMAKRGEKTMLFGPPKPVGLEDPKTGKTPYAVVQLRQDNAASTMYNTIGFQTHSKYGEQKRVSPMTPGLESAKFARYGKAYRNTYIVSPEVLNTNYETRKQAGLFSAGQMTGVEDCVESAGSRLVAGVNAAREAIGEETLVFPKSIALGPTAHYITTTSAKHFQPTNASYVLLSKLDYKVRDKQERHLEIFKQALKDLEAFKEEKKLD